MSAIGIPLPVTVSQGCIYLDYNATTPIFPEVAAAMQPYFHEFGNPSSTHPYGRECKLAVETARKQVATLINAEANEIYFCSCGTEADNWAIWGTVAAYRRKNPGITPHVITSAIEHPAVLEHLQSLHELGLLDFTAVGVNKHGIVSIADVESALTSRTCLITIMHSNNEVGTLQPIAEVTALGRSKGIIVHTDAAQSIGKVPIDVQSLHVNMLTIVGHKFGAPKGVAALYIRNGTKIERFLCGGGQEQGLRAGTENVILIVGLGKAAEIATNELLDEGLPQNGGNFQVNGPIHLNLKLPNTLSVSFRGILSCKLLEELSEDVAASAGAACHSSSGPTISSVLLAMGLPRESALGTLRLSVGRHTTEEDVRIGAHLILKYIRRVRGDKSIN